MATVNIAQPDLNGTLTSTLGTHYYGVELGVGVYVATGLPATAISGPVPSAATGDWLAKVVNIIVAAPHEMANTANQEYALVDIVIVNTSTNPNEKIAHIAKQVKVYPGTTVNLVDLESPIYLGHGARLYGLATTPSGGSFAANQRPTASVVMERYNVN